MKCTECGEPMVFIGTDKHNGLLGFWRCLKCSDEPPVDITNREFESTNGEFKLYNDKHDDKKTTISIKDYASWSSAFIEGLTFHELSLVRKIIDDRIDQLKMECKHEELVESKGIRYCNCCGIIFNFDGAVKWEDTGSPVKKIKFEENA